MDLAGVIRAVEAVREARGDGLGLLAPGVADSLQRVVPAANINLCELDWRRRRWLRSDVTTTDDFCTTRQWHSTGVYTITSAAMGATNR